MSRDINDCILPLQTAWKQAQELWKEKYPDLPQPFLTCTYRTPAEQDELYAIGRTKPGAKVTNARGGASYHNSMPSRAFDIAFVTMNKKLDWSPHLFDKMGAILMPLGVEYGGSWKKLKDRPHFQWV